MHTSCQMRYIASRHGWCYQRKAFASLCSPVSHLEENLNVSLSVQFQSYFSPLYFTSDVFFQNRFKAIFLVSFRSLLLFAQPSLLHGHHMLSSLYGLHMVTLCPTLPASLPVCLLSLLVSTILSSTSEWAPNFGGTFLSCSIVPRKSRTLWNSNVSKTSSKNKNLLRKKRSTQQKCILHRAPILVWEVQPTPHLQQTGKSILVFLIHHLIALTSNVIDCKFCGHFTYAPNLCPGRPSLDHCLSDISTLNPSVSCCSTDNSTTQANQMTKRYFPSM